MAIFRQKYILIIHCTHMLVHIMLALPRKLGKCGAVWCVLVYILIRVCLEKFPKNTHIFI